MSWVFISRIKKNSFLGKIISYTAYKTSYVANDCEVLRKGQQADEEAVIYNIISICLHILVAKQIFLRNIIVRFLLTQDQCNVFGLIHIGSFENIFLLKSVLVNIKMLRCEDFSRISYSIFATALRVRRIY